MTRETDIDGLQQFLTENINKPEFQQRWPHYKTRKRELRRMFEQRRGSDPKETPSVKKKPAKKKRKKKAAS